MLTNDKEEWYLIIYKRIWMFFLGSQKKKHLFSGYGSNTLTFFLIVGNLENSKIRRKQKFPQSKDSHSYSFSVFSSYLCIYLGYVTEIIQHMQFSI